MVKTFTGCWALIGAFLMHWLIMPAALMPLTGMSGGKKDFEEGTRLYIIRNLVLLNLNLESNGDVYRFR
jgi:hypothetical protein